ncbi:hypothetical protein C8R43DRAFT_1031219 [Mycena crocata]|nr:hypothetical protein C8R43DRAFT_1031219 [Mycena crocata]
MLANALRRQTRLVPAISARHNLLTVSSAIARLNYGPARSLSTSHICREGEIEKTSTGANQHPPSRKLYFRTPKDATENDLRALFEPYGRIDALWLLRKNSGFGFVEFVEQKAAEAAVEADESGPLNVQFAAPALPPIREVHIPQLPAGVTEADLRTALAVHGEIVHCHMKKKKRYANITFADQSAADAACKAGVRLSADTTLRVMYAAQLGP